ncbi:MAG: hypothetical protein HY579_14020 [Nitrospinae bacterium]|nr:hypothetical protein [Nitrospinota bacterium]
MALQDRIKEPARLNKNLCLPLYGGRKIMDSPYPHDSKGQGDRQVIEKLKINNRRRVAKIKALRQPRNIVRILTI